ncbi:glycoside hydrolase family 43 protein [Microbulbifer rhizosphaerae]|uniref:GH43 family beta-xylosidase n=1 Tax=Microbulbifer rhizosphaerae TaxID=1562603 RepID=A0A7W4Z8K3_9GAMM|nr:GH43 family beta-xylosidase [Microbulbifer rhizosphaerae]
MTESAPLIKPLIEQRADPYIYKHHDGYYYFIASVPEYDRLELRRSQTLAGLAEAPGITVWRKPETGPYSDLIWAPEIHFIDGTWCIYFAAAPSREILDNLFQHRMYALTTTADNPQEGNWQLAQVDSGIDAFCLDATSFAHRGERYYLWAQKEPGIPGNSNLYIAPMDSPISIVGKPIRLSIPEFDWETVGFAVNEGPAVIARHGRVFISYSASATDHNYCMGLLYADEDADLLDPASWHKSPQPVFQSCHQRGIYGPGHNSFTVSEDGERDILVYHARTYTKIEGDPLWDPNRHTYIKAFGWSDDGMPVFGSPAEP